MVDRRVGDLGEAEFRRWVKQEGATLNKAFEDRTGWDFFLEIPLPERSRVGPRDRQQEGYQCLIQVKSTDSKRQYRDLELSKWKWLVENPQPAFFLALHFDGKKECQQAYLVHIWKEEVTRVLRRVRELSSSGDRVQLNKHTLRLTWGSQDLLRETSGQALIARISEIVGKSQAAYSERKLGLLKSIGYEDANAQVKARIAVPPEYRKQHPNELLVDSILGLVPQLELVGGEIREIRFGIPSSTATEIIKGTKLKLGPGKPVRTGSLVFRTRDRSREVVLPVKVFAPGGIRGKINQDFLKLLFDLPFARFILSPHRNFGEVQFNLPGLKKQFVLSKAVSCARFMQLIRDLKNTSSQVLLDLWHDDLSIGTLEVNRIDFPKESLNWADLISMGYEVAASLDLPSDLVVTTEALAKQYNALIAIHAATVDCARHKIAFTFSLDEGSPPPEEGLQMCFPVHVELTLEKKRLIVFESMIGFPEKEQTEAGEFVVRVQRAEIDFILRLAPDESLPRDRAEYLDEIAESRAKEGGVLYWWHKRPGGNR